MKAKEPAAITMQDMNRRSEVERVFCKSNAVSFKEIACHTILIENPMTQEQRLLVEGRHPRGGSQAFTSDLLYAKKRVQAVSPFLNIYYDFTAFSDPLDGDKKVIRHFVALPRGFLSEALRVNKSHMMNSVFLTKLLYSMIEAGCALQDADLAHGNITANSILFEEPCVFKLLDHFSSLNPVEYFERLSRESDQKARALGYLSPEVYIKIINKDRFDKINVAKHDVFCLGLLLLELGTDRTIYDTYNSDGTFNKSKFENLLNEFRANMVTANNKLLLAAVTDLLLQFDHNSRLDFIGLKKRLPAFEEVEKYFKDHLHIDPYTSYLECTLLLTQTLDSKSGSKRPSI